MVQNPCHPRRRKREGPKTAEPLLGGVERSETVLEQIPERRGALKEISKKAL